MDVETPTRATLAGRADRFISFFAVFEALSSSFGILPNGRHGRLLDVNFGVSTPKNRLQNPVVAGFCLTSVLTSKM